MQLLDFERTYLSDAQIKGATKGQLAKDLLSLMKGLPYSIFAREKFVKALYVRYPAESEAEVMKAINAALDSLVDQKLIEQHRNRDTDEEDMSITLEGAFLKQFDDHTERHIQRAHIGTLRACLHHALLELDTSQPKNELLEQVEIWKEKAVRAIKEHIGTEDADRLKAIVYSEERGFLPDIDYVNALEAYLEETPEKFGKYRPTIPAKASTPVNFASRVRQLVMSWEDFRFQSRRIDQSKIESWLGQFPSEDQPLMLTLLENTLFFSEATSRGLMKTMYSLTALALKIERPSYIISAFGNSAKSGYAYVRMFRQENSLVDSDDAPTFSNIEPVIKAKTPDALIFIEDVIGSGKDARDLIDKLKEKTIADLLEQQQIPVWIWSICANPKGLQNVRDHSKGLKFQVYIEALYQPYECFSDQALIFANAEDRERAKYLAADLGSKLRPGKSLGFGDSQMLVVFHCEFRTNQNKRSDAKRIAIPM